MGRRRDCDVDRPWPPEPLMHYRSSDWLMFFRHVAKGVVALLIRSLLPEKHGK